MISYAVDDWKLGWTAAALSEARAYRLAKLTTKAITL